MRVSLIFAIIVSFMLLFRRISDSRFTWIHDFEENLTESVGPMPFPAQYLICRHGQTDRQTDRQTDGLTDELIWGGPLINPDLSQRTPHTNKLQV